MSRAYPLRLAVAVILLRGVRASQYGDDFSNNLFSDLAPLLALFGEQVAKQFMSQSLGWADHIIFAMGPLGIVTAMVGAIRVGGPRWLRAIIGRARENRADSEVELMSSTSHEVCELWNGQQIVRIMGSPPVKQILRFSPNAQTDPGEMYGGFQTLENASDKLLEKCYRGPKQEQQDPPHSQDGSHKGSDLEGLRSEGSHPVQDNAGACAPNISLNTRNRVDRTELRIVAAIGTVLQLGVLVYSGFAKYYPTMKFKKQGIPVEDYAFPAMAVGTVTLVIGLSMCAYVVESSTKEDTYQVARVQPPNTTIRVLWLQKAETVSDQSFGSFAIFPKHAQKTVYTSRRKPGLDDESDDVHIGTQALTIAVTMITLCGFVVQFIGLRGMHWSASVAQLGVTLVMTILRAFVRRGLTKRPRVQQLPHGYEVDWLATRSSVLDSYWPSDTPESTLGPRSAWRWVRGLWARLSGTQNVSAKGGARGGFWSEVYYKPNGPTTPAGSPDPDSGAETGSLQDLVGIRVHLGSLTGWPSLAADKAISIATSMDIVLNTLFPDDPSGFSWSFPIRALSNQKAEITHQKTSGGKWETQVDVIEAILSLWLFAVHEKEKLPGLGRQSIRLLGSDTESLRRDLKWWVDGEPTRILIAKEVVPETPEHDRDTDTESPRIVRYGELGRENRVEGDKKIKIASHRVLCGNTATPDAVASADSTGHALAALSDVPLPLLFAQDMFQAFMLAVTDRLKGPIDGGANVRYTSTVETSNDSSWKSFTLQNPKLSKVAQGVQRAGLGSLAEVYSVIIPPLSIRGKLPDASAVIELAREQAESHELRNHWRQSAEIYLWLFRSCRSDPLDAVSRRATAVLVGFFRSVIVAAKLSKNQDLGGYMDKVLREVRLELKEEMGKNCDKDFLSEVVGLYQLQGRSESHVSLTSSDWEPLVIPAHEYERGEVVRTPSLSFTPLHCASSSMSPLDDLIKSGANVNGRDVLYWSPLHYASCQGVVYALFSQHQTKNFAALLGAGADANAKDLAGRTPLHYCCSQKAMSNTDVLRTLLHDGADLAMRGRDGKTPLHSAAMSGDANAAKLLIEAGASVEALDASWNTPLHWAGYYGHDDVVKVLLQGGHVKVRNREGRTPTHLAAMAGKSEVFELLSGQGIDEAVGDRDSTGCTTLHVAAAGGHERIVEFLLTQGADTEARDNYRQTALHWAARNGRKSTVKSLISHGADKEAKESRQWTALHCAVRGNSMGGDNDMPVSEDTPEEAARRQATTSLLLDEGANKEAEGPWRLRPLHLAAKSGNGEMVRILLESEVDKEAQDRGGLRPLHYAASEGKEASVVLLLDRDADKEAQDHKGRTALHLAAIGNKRGGGRSEIVALLLDRGADKEAQDDKGRTALHLAAIGNKRESYGSEIVALLLDRELNRDARDHYGRTALHSAVGGQRPKPYVQESVVHLLISQGADIEDRDTNGETAILYAAKSYREAEVRLLFDLKADIEARDNKGRTVLHLALARHQNTIPILHLTRGTANAVVHLLLSLGVDIEAKDNDGLTALHFAAMNCRVAEIRLLLDKGADIGAKGDAGRTALHFAVADNIYYEEMVVDLLLSRGADTEVKDNNGQTALHWAAKGSRLARVRALLDQGADIEATDNAGWTALHFRVNGDDPEAKGETREAVVNLLLNWGANKRAEDNDGQTALDLAKKLGLTEIAQKLAND